MKGQSSLGAEGHSGEAKMLRPRRDDDDLTSTYLREDTREEMRLYDNGQMERMYNECIEEHSVTESRVECGNPRVTLLPEKLKWDFVGSVVYSA